MTFFATIPVAIVVCEIAFWYFRCRDLDPQSVVTQYEPPEKVSPAAARYLRTGRVDATSVAATLADLAVAKCVQVFPGQSGYRLINLKPASSIVSQLPEEEAALYSLFLENGRLNERTIDPKTLGESAFQSKLILDRQFKGRYWKYNGVAIGSLWICAAALYVGRCIQSGDTARVSEALLIFVTCALLSPVFWGFLAESKRAAAGQFSSRHTIQLVLGAPLFFGIPVLFLYLMSPAWPRVEFLSLIASLCALALGTRLFREPTDAGCAARNQIEGYRRFLITAEQDRLNRTAQPSEIIHFERSLPYAIALDVREKWGDVFTEFLAPAGTYL